MDVSILVFYYKITEPFTKKKIRNKKIKTERKERETGGVWKQKPNQFLDKRME